MPYKLNDREVFSVMYDRAVQIKKRGGKVFLVTPGHDAEYQSKLEAAIAKSNGVMPCQNCDGVGELGLTIFTGGPFMSGDNKKSVTYYEGKYYTQDVKFFPCPICKGQKFTAVEANNREISL